MVKLKYTAKSRNQVATKGKKPKMARFKLDDARPFVEAIEREYTLMKWHQEQLALAVSQLKRLIGIL